MPHLDYGSVITKLIFAVIANFLQIGSHHFNEDFAVRGKEPRDEVQIYTWKDATLRELTDLVVFPIPFHSSHCTLCLT